MELHVQWQVLALQAAVVAFVAAFMYLVRPKKGSTFLIDFYCLRPPNRYRLLPHPSSFLWASSFGVLLSHRVKGSAGLDLMPELMYCCRVRAEACALFIVILQPA